MNAWTSGRFLGTAGLVLSAEERRRVENIHSWRFLIPKFVADAATSEPLADIYCFGAAHGHTVSELVAAFRFQALRLPTIHAFDSFEGLPDEEPGIAIPPVWRRGAFANSLEDFQRRVAPMNFAPGMLVVHAGWFADTLKAGDVAAGVLKPACYVDFDADLYCSTRDALAFMFGQRLIRAGTLIGYDDWGDTELWRAGESRAHQEVTERYGVRATQLFSWGEPPLVRTLFRVDSVAGAAG